MDLAHALADAGAAHGTVVVADQQGAGRGRSGQPWSSPAGSGVWASVVLRTLAEAPAGLLSLRIGLLLAESLDATAGDLLQLKWPNDVYLRGQKLAGVLSEARWQGATLQWIVVGVGINVTAPPESTAFAALGSAARRHDVLCSVAQAARGAAEQGGPLTTAEMAAFAERDCARGRAIVSPHSGIAGGVTASGALRICTSAGETHATAGSLIFASTEDAH
jgi:BirA family transcriptional regulator, biotin operon repressor / biotin---[acetyl-CoA-carboxylase] ligase